MQLTDALSRVRLEIGDPLQPFMTSTLGDGLTSLYDLPKQNISSINVAIEQGASLTNLVQNSDYTLNPELGYVQLAVPVPNGAVITMQGQAWGLFTDNDLTIFINDSVNQHCLNRTIKERIRNRQGFITYRQSAMTLDNLPMIEEPLLIMLSVINVMWALANDASSDTNIQTAEGTNVDRVARYQQLMGHISDLTERYQMYCGQLNVGVFRTETLKLRRVSKTTGRLVPIFVDREYDDNEWPDRQIPPIDGPWTDPSGIPSPLWNAQGM